MLIQVIEKWEQRKRHDEGERDDNAPHEVEILGTGNPHEEDERAGRYRLPAYFCPIHALPSPAGRTALITLCPRLDVYLGLLLRCPLSLVVNETRADEGKLHDVADVCRVSVWPGWIFFNLFAQR